MEYPAFAWLKLHTLSCLPMLQRLIEYLTILNVGDCQVYNSVIRNVLTWNWIFSGPAALSGFRFDKSFSTPLRSILIYAIVEHMGPDTLAVVRSTGVYLLDFFCSGIQFYVLLSPYLCFIFFIS